LTFGHKFSVILSEIVDIISCVCKKIWGKQEVSLHYLISLVISVLFVTVLID